LLLKIVILTGFRLGAVLLSILYRRRTALFQGILGVYFFPALKTLKMYDHAYISLPRGYADLNRADDLAIRVAF